MTTEFSQDTKVALCVACTLAEKMKDCINCQFYIGLAVRKVYYEMERLNALEVTEDPSPAERFAASVPEPIWNAYCDYVRECWNAEAALIRKARFSLLEERLAEAAAGCNH